VLNRLKATRKLLRELELTLVHIAAFLLLVVAIVRLLLAELHPSIH